MEKHLEQRIRERAYELWMQHGSQQGRADEYWYEAEREITGNRGGEASNGMHPIIGSDETAPLETGQTSFGSEEDTVETSPAPLGMTSQTLDEVLNSPASPKPRRRKSTAAEVAESVGETVTAPKRRRSPKTPS
ncbi:DUF2934 domain-containing protein [Microvirga solisilvae]|uniref:DUF2934 domain-containing protein n=1 Tax=Microvirga solisilvae TaxID=2919498 RepID=UPI001FAF2C90|nr:DUF2934 domain-containing protein [Microvirga solisilvae]